MDQGKALAEPAAANALTALMIQATSNSCIVSLLQTRGFQSERAPPTAQSGRKY
jgi:hypothetical protein